MEQRQLSWQLAEKLGKLQKLFRHLGRFSPPASGHGYVPGDPGKDAQHRLAQGQDWPAPPPPGELLEDRSVIASISAPSNGKDSCLSACWWIPHLDWGHWMLLRWLSLQPLPRSLPAPPLPTAHGPVCSPPLAFCQRSSLEGVPKPPQASTRPVAVAGTAASRVWGQGGTWGLLAERQHGAPGPCLP